MAFSVPHYPIQEDARWLKPYEDGDRGPVAPTVSRPASPTWTPPSAGSSTALEKSGQREDTLIVFTSDNGGQKDYASQTDYGGKYGPYPTLGDNRPLRGWKGELYEGGIRVPAFVFWEGKLGPTAVNHTTSYLDVFPTLARLGGVDLASRWRLEGRDIGQLLAGEAISVSAPTLYWNTGSQAAVLHGDWKLIITRTQPGSVELYNLADDPAEARNLATEKPEQVEALRTILAKQERLNR